MKHLNKSILLIIVFTFLYCCKKNTESTEINEDDEKVLSNIIPEYKPIDIALYDTIIAMDEKYFEAYNTCDLETQSNIYDDDLEFYHDLGGLETDKSRLLNALKNNICDKVTRQLVEGSMEVYPIADYGAVAEGYHTFFNKLEPDAPQRPSKFITIWKDTEEGWKMSRIVSLH